MKLLKVFGIVAGIHVVALILIFANPGCSTTTKSAATPADTVARNDTSPSISVPNMSGAQAGPATPIAAPDAASPVQPSPVMFNPDAPAVATDGRYSPTRPGTPVASALQAEPINDVTPVSTYTVARGDSLWSVAKHNNLTVAELVAANNLKASSTLRQGQKLIIPGKSGKSAKGGKGGMQAEAAAPARSSSAPAPAADAKASADAVTHVVKPGETLGAIARKYGVRLGEIATANNITDPAKIRPGQTLVIPGSKGASGKTSSAKAAAPAQDEAPTITPDAPIFTPPPADKPLDQGLKPNSGAAPVIPVEDTGSSAPSN